MYVNNWQLIEFFKLHSHLIYTKIPTLMVTRVKFLCRELFNFFFICKSSKTDNWYHCHHAYWRFTSSCTGLSTMFAWNGRHKLMAGARTCAGAPNPLLPKGPDPCRGPQHLGLWDTMCEADARGGVQTLLTVHTSINGRETFSLWKLWAYCTFKSDCMIFHYGTFGKSYAAFI